MIWIVWAFFVGCAVGALVERYRWLHSEAAKLWERTTGERERLL